MSKIGNLPIKINEGVKVELDNQKLTIAGPKGELNLSLPPNIKMEKINATLRVKRLSNDRKTRSLHGLWRVLINNAILGVSCGWEKKLDFKGVGFKAEVQGNKLILSVGFSHLVEILAPEDISFNVTKNIITVSGIDKQKVGQIAAVVRRVRPVEPYKGKGIKYLDEIPRKKAGKAAKSLTATTT